MVLIGNALVQALSTTPFALLRVIGAGGKPVAIVSPEQAIMLLASKAVQAIGSKNRVRYLRTESATVELPRERVFPRDDTFWSGDGSDVPGRGCVRFWKDQRSEPGVTV